MLEAHLIAGVVRLQISRERLSMMLEVQVELDFTCCSCGARVGVTLRCAGQGLSQGLHAVAAVEVACPTCTGVNQIVFEPSGLIHAVAPRRGLRWWPEPSIN